MLETKVDISIVITTYNYASYIQESINSCLLQNDSPLNYEVIVVDDGSTDQTPIILDKINNQSLKKYRIDNSGIEVASNFGFDKALGKYIVRLDADDILMPNFLREVSEYLVYDYDFYYSDYYVINGSSQVVGNMELPEFNADEIRARGDFLATGTLYAADLLKEFYYSTDVKNSGLENYELILRMIVAGKLGKHIPEKLFCYRRHAMSVSTLKNVNIARNGTILCKKFGLGPYTTNKFHPYNPNHKLT